MAKKLVPDYDIELGKDSSLKQGIIQNIFDKIAASEKQIYAKMNAPISKGTSGIASFNDIARNFIRKNIDDTVFANLSFDKTLKSTNFTTGLTGSGWSLSRNDAGKATLEIDDVIVRNSLRAQVLTYERINTVGGTLVISAAWCTVTSSKTTGTDVANRIGVYYKPDGVSTQRWIVGDQAMIKAGVDKYLLTVVTKADTSPNENGEYYIELYNNATAGVPSAWMEKQGSYIPQKDDVIVQYGNRLAGNEARQNIIVISSLEGEEGYPVIQQYKGVNDFDLSNKTITRISKDVYFGSADLSKYLWWNKDGDGELRVKGTILQSPSGDTFPNMVFRGTWIYYESYYRGDLVTYNGSTYLCITNDIPSVSTPDSNAKWQLYASKGDKGEQGDDGDPGTNGINSRSVSLTTDKQVFEYDSDGVLKSGQGNSTITATAVNTEGAVYYEFYVNGVSVQNTTSNTYTLSPASNTSAMPKVVYVYIRENTTTGPSLAADTITIYGVTEGSDAYTIVMSNEAHTLPCNPDGTVITYAGSGNKVAVYYGSVKLTPVYSTPPSWDGVFLISRSLEEGDISLGGASVVNNEAVFANCANMADDLVSVNHVLNIENKITATRVQTLTKSRNGAEGVQGIAVRYTRWKSGNQYFNGNISGNADRYLDYVTDYDTNGVVAAYKCIVSHTSEIANKPGTTGGNAYWESITYIPVIASDLVLANQAVIGGFVFSPAYDEFGTPVAAANQKFRSSDSPTSPNILIKGNGYASFAKGNVRFDENGNANIKGFIEAVGGKIGTMSITGVLSAAGIEISPTAIESLVDLATPASEDLTTTYTEDTGVDEQAYAQISSLEPTFTGFTEVRFDIYVDSIQFDNTTYDIIITEGQNVVASYHGVPVAGSTITVIDAIQTKEGETYNIDAFISVGGKFGSGTQTNYVKIYGTGTGGRLVNTGIKLKTKLSSEGFFSFWSDDDYVYFKNAGEFSVRKGNYGMRITTSGVQKWSGGAWTSIDYANW